MRHRRAPRVTYQAELFATETDRPSWRELPATTREAVISLLAQILSEQSPPSSPSLAKEGKHE